MQTGTIISCTSGLGAGSAQATIQVWRVQFSYALDAGGTATGFIVVGNGAVEPQPGGYGLNGFYQENAVTPLWTSLSATITVSPNPPGTTNPVQLACPAVVAKALFGIPASYGP